MRRLIFFSIFLISLVYCTAQIPSNLYDNLGIYKSVAVYEDGVQVPFEGIDYFYIDYSNDGSIWVIFWFDDYNEWGTTGADFIEQTSDYTKYETQNPNGEDLFFIISNDKRDIIISKDGDDIAVAYELTNSGNNNYTPSYNYQGGAMGGYSGASPSSSGRTCAGCRGTGKCTSCNGKGWYYQETGYYTGNSRKEKTTCIICHGSGRCGTCHGNGTIR